jgi:hypothetical protein
MFAFVFGFSEAKNYFWHQTVNLQHTQNLWYIFYLGLTIIFSDAQFYWCDDKSLSFSDAKIQATSPLPASPPWWPTANTRLMDADPQNVAGSGCNYTADGSGPGIIICPGKPTVSCWEAAKPGEPIAICALHSTLADAVYPIVVCGKPG